MNKNLKALLRSVAPRFVINRYNMLCDGLRIKEIIKRSPLPYVKGARPAGINLYGDFELGTGLSRSVNLLKKCLDAAGVPHSLHQVEEFSGIPADGAARTDYAVNVFHLQPPVLPGLLKRLPGDILDGHYNIVFWAWETPEIPVEWSGFFDYFNEIWTFSSFCAKTFSKYSTKPVRVYPLAVYEETVAKYNNQLVRSKYGIKDNCFVCIMMYDPLSGSERKNPDGAIECFNKAFTGGNENSVLLIKSKGLSRAEERRLIRKTDKGNNIIIIDEKLSHDETQQLLACADVLISLHRSEGFGLPLAEMMNLGGVVLATDYSASKEFLNEENGMPVGCRLIRTHRDFGPYRAGTIWAEPDIEDAAGKLRRLYENRDYCHILGNNAQNTIKEKLSPDLIGDRIKKRVKAICRTDQI